MSVVARPLLNRLYKRYELTCCDDMLDASSIEDTCTPKVWLTKHETNGQPHISSCDGSLSNMPLKFCPWCGVSLSEITFNDS